SQQAPQADARLPQANEDPPGSVDPEAPPPEGAEAPHGDGRQEVALRPEWYPRRVRLRKRSEYLAVQRHGRKVQADHFLLLFVPAQATRIGMTVSSRVGN